MTAVVVWPPVVAVECPVAGDVVYRIDAPTQDALNNLYMSLAEHVRTVHNDEPAALALEAVVLGTHYEWTVIP